MPAVSSQETPLCVNGTTRPCGSTIGVCEAGTRACVGGNWSECTDGIGPGTEICGNFLDDNCNGQTDECTLSLGLILVLLGIIVMGFAGVLVILSIDESTFQ